MRMCLAACVLAIICPGLSRAGSVVRTDAAIVEAYPDKEIADLAKFLQQEDSLDFDREGARGLICQRLGAKPWQDTTTLEAFLTAWESEVPVATDKRLRSSLKLVDLYLKDLDKAANETERESRIQRAVIWLEKILAADPEKAGLQVVAGDWQNRALQPGAREMHDPLPPEMVEERARRILARIAGDAQSDAIKWRRSAANRLAHQAALLAQKSGNFAPFDDLVKRHGKDADVGEIFVVKRLRSLIFGETRTAQIPVPKTTPYDGEAAQRVNYLEGFSFGFRSVVAGMQVEYPMTGEDPLRQAERDGWIAGVSQARTELPEKANEIPIPSH